MSLTFVCDLWLHDLPVRLQTGVIKHFPMAKMCPTTANDQSEGNYSPQMHHTSIPTQSEIEKMGRE